MRTIRIWATVAWTIVFAMVTIANFGAAHISLAAKVGFEAFLFATYAFGVGFCWWDVVVTPDNNEAPDPSLWTAVACGEKVDGLRPGQMMFHHDEKGNTRHHYWNGRCFMRKEGT